jgi:hypothetical protein
MQKSESQPAGVPPDPAMNVRKPLPATTIVPPAGGPKTARTASSTSSRAAWSCSACRCAIPKESVLSGTAAFVNEQLLCAHCLAKRVCAQNQARRQKIFRIAGFCGIAVLMVAAAIGFWSSRRAELRRMREAVQSSAEQVTTALQGNRYIAARQAFDALKVALHMHREAIDSAEAEQILREANQAIDRWLEAHFSIPDERVKRILIELLSKWPGTENDLERIVWVGIEGGNLSVRARTSIAATTFAALVEPADPNTRHLNANDEINHDPRIAEACRFLGMVGERFPEFSNFTLKWVSLRDTDLGTYKIKREDLSLISKGTASSLIDAQNPQKPVETLLPQPEGTLSPTVPQWD